MAFSFCKHIFSNSQSFNSLLDSKINGRFLFQLDTYILGLQHLYLCAYGIHLDSCVRWFIFFSNHCDVWSFPPRSWLAPRHSGGWLCTHCSIQKRMSWQLGTLVFFYTVFFHVPAPIVTSWHVTPIGSSTHDHGQRFWYFLRAPRGSIVFSTIIGLATQQPPSE